MKLVPSVLVLLVALTACNAPAKIKSDTGVVEGTPAQATYSSSAEGQVHSTNPAGEPMVHMVIDETGLDAVNGASPSAGLGLVLEGIQAFVISPSDLSASGVEVTVNPSTGEVTVKADTFSSSKSDPILARAQWVAALGPVLTTAIKEANETQRAQWEAFAETVQAIAPEISTLIRGALGGI